MALSEEQTNRFRPLQRYEQVAERLAADIRSGALAPGERQPDDEPWHPHRPQEPQRVAPERPVVALARDERQLEVAGIPGEPDQHEEGEEIRRAGEQHRDQPVQRAGRPGPRIGRAPAR